MQNAYIKVADIRKLLEESEPKNGLIRKKDFQLAITKLKEHKEPKEQPIQGVNNVRDMIGRITAYQNDIRTHKVKLPIREYLGDWIKIRKRDKINIRFIDGSLLQEENIIFSKDQIMDILGISVPTFYRYSKMGVIVKQSGGLWILINDLNKINIGIIGAIGIPRINQELNITIIDKILEWYDIGKIKDALTTYK